MLMCFTYSSGVVVFSIIAYFVRDWKTLTLIVSVPFITFYIYWWFLPESIRWLLVKKKYQRAEKIIQKAARINHINIPPNFLSTKLDENELNMMDQNQLINYQFNVSSMANDMNEKGENLVKKQLTMKDLLTHKNMRLKTFIITFAWVANVLSYVGLQNYLTFFNDLHLNFLLASLAELPGYIFLWLTLDRIGRKFPFCTSMLISGFSVLAVNIFYQYSKMLVLVLALIGKLGISTSFVIIYLYASEIYPTELRGTGMALTLMVARIFTIAVPFINYLGTTWILIPTIIMGLVTTLAGFLALLLPETLNKKLPETLEESEKIGLDFGIFKTCKKAILNAIFSI